MTTVNLTTEQLEAITEAFAKGESVTLQPPIKQWEPKEGLWQATPNRISRDCEKLCANVIKEIKTFSRLLAYRDEFDPTFRISQYSYIYYLYNTKRGYMVGTGSPDAISVSQVYMSQQVAKDLVAKLNSGEVVL